MFNDYGKTMFKRIFIPTIVFVFSLTIINAQNYNSSASNSDDWSYDFWDADTRPLIEVQYGFGEPKHKKFNSEFNDIGLVELKLGNSGIDYYYDGIVELNSGYIFVSQLSQDLKDDTKDELKVDSKLLRIGFGTRTGYGYGNEAFSLIPYFADNFMMSKLTDTNLPDVRTFVPDESFEVDQEILGRYEGAFRFSSSSEGGVKIELSNFISVNAGYEYSVVYPRFMTWKHLGSVAIEKIGLTALDNFIDEIFDRSPLSGPIVNFVLKNAYSYAFYTLKKEDMNWPFESETPLTYETFKFGVSFNF